MRLKLRPHAIMMDNISTLCGRRFHSVILVFIGDSSINPCTVYHLGRWHCFLWFLVLTIQGSNTLIRSQITRYYYQKLCEILFGAIE